MRPSPPASWAGSATCRPDWTVPASGRHTRDLAAALACQRRQQRYAAPVSMRRGHAGGVTASGGRGPRAPTTLRDRCLSGGVPRRRRRRASASWEGGALTARTIAFVFSPPPSWLSRWRHLNHADRPGPGAGRTIAFAPGGLGSRRRPRLRNATFPITRTKSTPRSHSRIAAPTRRPSCRRRSVCRRGLGGTRLLTVALLPGPGGYGRVSRRAEQSVAGASSEVSFDAQFDITAI